MQCRAGKLPVVAYIRSMTFKGYLEKNGYLIRVWHEDGRYEVEYSNDGFETKKVKGYGIGMLF